MDLKPYILDKFLKCLLGCAIVLDGLLTQENIRGEHFLEVDQTETTEVGTVFKYSEQLSPVNFSLSFNRVLEEDFFNLEIMLL
jgi:hypothetical protein